MNVLELRSNLLQVDIPEIVLRLNTKYTKEFTKANKSQMWDGKNPDGSEISPSYLNDPYFKTRKAAEKYANWKSKGGFANPKRNKYTPNLYINGYFYSTLEFDAKESKIVVNDSFGNKVANSHREALGVSDDNLKLIGEKGYVPDFHKAIEKITGLSIN